MTLDDFNRVLKVGLLLGVCWLWGFAQVSVDVLGSVLKIWRVDGGFAYARFGDLGVSVPIHLFPGVIGVALSDGGLVLFCLGWMVGVWILGI
jgi:acetamidase/formamidase